MKIFALIVLLISICCLEGALVRRQAEASPQGQVSNSFSNPQLTELLQQLQQQAEEFASSFRNAFRQEAVEDFRNQAETAFQQLKNSFTPFTEQLRQNVAPLFFIPTEPEQPAQEGE